jgi:hypothetical protein
MNPIKAIKYIFRSISNLISWFPIIFKDRNWDHFYFHIIMKKKLERMRDYQINSGHAVNSQYTAERINTCIKLLDRIIKDDFSNEEFWKDVNHEWIELDEEYVELKTVSKYSQEEISTQINKENALRRKYVKTLYSILGKRVETFWD